MPHRGVHKGTLSGLGLYSFKDQHRSGYHVQLLLEGKPIRMEVVIGSVVPVVSGTVYRKLFIHLSLKPTYFYLKTCSSEQLALLGEIQVRVKFQTQEVQLLLLVAEGDKPVLLGRNWMEKMKLDWATIFKVSQENAVG